MNKKYPKFLTTVPTFCGLNFIDLIIVGFTISLLPMIGVASNATPFIAVLGVVLHIVIVRFVDVRGIFFAPTKGHVVNWDKDLNSGNHG